jgi:hypothetical protein
MESQPAGQARRKLVANRDAVSWACCHLSNNDVLVTQYLRGGAQARDASVRMWRHNLKQRAHVIDLTLAEPFAIVSMHRVICDGNADVVERQAKSSYRVRRLANAAQGEHVREEDREQHRGRYKVVLTVR